MRVGKDDALILLRKWMEESSLVSCEVSMPIVAVRARGKVTSVTEKSVTIESSDDFSVVLVPIGLASGFGYAEPRGEFPESAKVFESALVILFGDETDKDPPHIGLSLFRS